MSTPAIPSVPLTPPLPSILNNPDLAAAYQKTFDALGTAYWDASDLASKDLIHGTQEAIGDIITKLDAAQIDANTTDFLALTSKIKAVNANLKEIEANVAKITKNIDTVSTLLAAANKVLSLMPL